MVLCIIDTQRLITNRKLYAFDQFVENIKALLDSARKNGIEVIFIRHDDGVGHALTKHTPGFEIYDAFAPLKGEKIFDKTVNSAFKETGLLTYLKQKQETDLIIAGLQTEYCINATIICAFEHGFHVTVPAYANSTIDNEYMRKEDSYTYYNEYIWPNRYAECLPMQEVLELMCNRTY